MQLANMAAIVTGGDSGIGRAIAIALGTAGAAVTINYHSNHTAAESVRQQIVAAGGRALTVQGDVGRVDDIQHLIDQTVQAFGRLDVLVNNAGMETRTSVLESTEQDFDRVIGINLRGAFFGTQRAARQMINQGNGGRIINITSVHEDCPMPGNAPYCCAKGGMRMLTRNAGIELAPHGITVVGVGPGAIATPINTSTLEDPAKKAQLEHAIPLGRVGTPEDVANLVVWLASSQSAYVTATTYFVDGGLMHASGGL